MHVEENIVCVASRCDSLIVFCVVIHILLCTGCRRIWCDVGLCKHSMARISQAPFAEPLSLPTEGNAWASAAPVRFRVVQCKMVVRPIRGVGFMQMVMCMCRMYRYAVSGVVSKTSQGSGKFSLQLWDTLDGSTDHSDLTGAH